MKESALDLRKWAEKTAQAVRHICSKKTGIPVGISLLFYDPMATNEEKWNYTINLAGDPQTDMSPEERKRLEACFEYIMEGVKRIYQEGVPDEEEIAEEFKARGQIPGRMLN